MVTPLVHQIRLADALGPLGRIHLVNTHHPVVKLASHKSQHFRSFEECLRDAGKELGFIGGGIFANDFVASFFLPCAANIRVFFFKEKLVVKPSSLAVKTRNTIKFGISVIQHVSELV